MFSNVFQAINNNFDAFNRNQQKVSNLYTPKQLLEVFYKKCVLENFTKFTGKHQASNTGVFL